jgi:pimeloyl-ACP methyl ester carboxylesterase
MKLTRVTIPSDSLALAGLTYDPDGPTDRLCAVLTHGYTASKESLDLLASYLAQKGTPCVTWDVRGHKLGHSGGELMDLRDAVDDLRAVAAWARARFAQPRCVLIGHSMGGLLSVAAAAETPEAAAVAAIAVGPEPTRGFQGPVGRAMLSLRADYVDGLEPLRLLEQLGQLVPHVAEIADRPSLFVAAKGDVLVKAEKMAAMAEPAGEQAEFHVVEGSHLEAPDRARGTVAAWLDRLNSPRV